MCSPRTCERAVRPAFRIPTQSYRPSTPGSNNNPFGVLFLTLATRRAIAQIILRRHDLVY
jgi:hypothetical protein